jgi:hypothetical protein
MSRCRKPAEAIERIAKTAAGRRDWANSGGLPGVQEARLAGGNKKRRGATLSFLKQGHRID